LIRNYPAYGRTIAAHLARGLKPICIGVLLSSRWGYFNHVPKVCIKPDEWAFGRLEFGFLHGMHVVAVPGDDCEPRQLAELILDLMRAGPRLLWAYNADGSKLYDGDWPSDLWNWVFELSGRKYAYAELKAAARVMEDAQARALAAWMREYQAIDERAGVEKAVQFHIDTEAIKDRVRLLFSKPNGPDEARAA
jgi:hypothetical protein